LQLHLEVAALRRFRQDLDDQERLLEKALAARFRAGRGHVGLVVVAVVQVDASLGDGAARRAPL
jgi:hypothetical protein